MDFQKGEKPILCEICDKTFCNESHLSDHMVIHRDGNPVNDRNGTKEDPRQCTSCNKYSSNKTELNDGCKNCIDTFSNAIPNANDFARQSGTQSIVKNKPWTTPNVPAAYSQTPNITTSPWIILRPQTRTNSK